MPVGYAMRFLFVYQDYAQPARELLDELQVSDVTLIVARKNAMAPTDDEILVLRAYRGADAAACEVNRKYRKRAAEYVEFCCEPKKFRFEDQQLREWLVPKGHVTVAYEKPSATLLAAANRSPNLILHADALHFADQLVEHRWRFVTASADLLARYADGEQLGALRDWKQNFAVDFAANGPVSFKYKWSHVSEYRDGRTEWHLKEGDNTTRESAARIYFARVEFSKGAKVVVLYVGPHPDKGERTLTLTTP
jgi:hypothetical protein